jgi:hypothetical protein
VPHILNFGNKWRWVVIFTHWQLYLREGAYRTHWIGHRVGSRASLDTVVVNRNVSAPARSPVVTSTAGDYTVWWWREIRIQGRNRQVDVKGDKQIHCKEQKEHLGNTPDPNACHVTWLEATLSQILWLTQRGRAKVIISWLNSWVEWLTYYMRNKTHKINNYNHQLISFKSVLFRTFVLNCFRHLFVFQRED